jgi:hypothetical protein
MAAGWPADNGHPARRPTAAAHISLSSTLTLQLGPRPTREGLFVLVISWLSAKRQRLRTIQRRGSTRLLGSQQFEGVSIKIESWAQSELPCLSGTVLKITIRMFSNSTGLRKRSVGAGSRYRQLIEPGACATPISLHANAGVYACEQGNAARNIRVSRSLLGQHSDYARPSICNF